MHLILLAALITVETTLQDGVKSVETVECPERNGVVSFVWPRSRVPRGVKSVVVLPDFAEAQAGESGAWLMPNNSYGSYRELPNGYFRCGHVMMAMSGMSTPRGTYCAIVRGMRHSSVPVLVVQDGVYHLKTVFDRYMDDVYEDIAIDFVILRDGDANLSGIARCYRRYQLERGAVRPLVERAKERPCLAYAAKYPEVRIRQAWKQAPSPVLEQVTRNEPPVRPVVTFDRFKQIVDESVRQGVPGAEFCLVGWNSGGHDGRFPQIFPVEPSLGGEERLRDSIAYAQSRGFLVVGHSSFRDCYMIADNWDAEYVVEKNPDGTLRHGKEAWSGGRLYTICPQRAYERFCPKQCAEMSALGYQGLFYIDVTTSKPLFPCNDPRHRLNNGEREVWENNILRQLQDSFGGSASEGGFDFCASTLDYVLTVQWEKPFEAPRSIYVDGYFPAWQIVYNGIILSTPFRTMINCQANPDRRFLLKLAEFGGRPTFYWHSWFVTGKPPSMGTWDLEATTDEKLSQSVTWMKEGCEEYSRRNDLQLAFMDAHETIRPGFVRVTYSNGAKMLVNYNSVAEQVEGVSVPPLDYCVIRP